jgi:hypothetical protein
MQVLRIRQINGKKVHTVFHSSGEIARMKKNNVGNRWTISITKDGKNIYTAKQCRYKTAKKMAYLA